MPGLPKGHIGAITGGGNASAMKLDVTDRQACRAAAAEIARTRQVSILVNNAGINRRNPITGDPARARGTPKCHVAVPAFI